jgi:replication-associated recombination protein RarA
VLILNRLDERALCKLLDRAEAWSRPAAAADPEARDALVATADGDGRFLLNQAETLFNIGLPEPLDPKPAWASCCRSAVAVYDKDREGITTSSRRCISRSAAPTRRRRSTIWRGCWSAGEEPLFCCAG